MLHLIVWVVIYTVIVWLLGNSVRAWRDRFWFKVLFLPGTLLTALLQVVSGFLCLGAVKEVSFFRDGKPFLEFDRSRIAFVGGGLHVLLVHGLFFAIFFFVSTRMETGGLLDAHAVSLPNLYPYEVIEGEVEVSVGPYLVATGNWLGSSRDRPFVMLGFLYAAFALFVSMSISGAEWRRGAFILVLLGAITWVCSLFGVNFGLFSRGWWMGWSHFPDWWAVFSLFVTLSVLTLVAVTVSRLVFRVWQRATRSPAKAGSNKSSVGGSKPRSKVVS